MRLESRSRKRLRKDIKSSQRSAKHGRLGPMSELPDGLPSDPAELSVFAAALLDRCARLERLRKLAKDAQVGRSSEKPVAVLEAVEDRASPKTCKKRTAKRRANRGQLPEHLPCVVETLMPAETCCSCCEGVRFEIGSDESQRLDVVPAMPPRS